jgi:hypothetical protein
MATVTILSPIAISAFLLSFLASDRLFYHGLISRLFSLLYLEKRVRHNLRHRIARRDNRWAGRSTAAHHLRALFQLFCVRVILQQYSIDAPLSQQISFHLLRVVPGFGRGCLVHPIDSVDLLCLSGGFLEALNLLHLALLLAFTLELRDFLALVESALLFEPYALLVLEQARMP